MKRFLTILCCCLPFLLQAQSKTAVGPTDQPAYLQFPTVPNYKVTLPDGRIVNTKDNLKKNENAVVFVFSVDCDHCKHLTQEVLQNIDKFKKTKILMLTPFQPDQMKVYYNEYNIKNYPNIVMASEPTRQIMYFYNLHYFPGLFIYDKKQKFVKGYEGTVKLEEILSHLN